MGEAAEWFELRRDAAVRRAGRFLSPRAVVEGLQTPGARPEILEPATRAHDMLCLCTSNWCGS